MKVVIIVVASALLLVAGAGLYWLYMSWQDYGIQASLGAREMLAKRLSDQRFSDVIGAQVASGEIVWINGARWPELWALPACRHPYAIRLLSTQGPLVVNGVTVDHAVGVIGYPGLDRDVDFGPGNRVVEYDPTNGICGRGDIIYIFHK